MVDFNSETTMTRPRTDIVNFMILQQLQNVLLAYQDWEEGKDSGREDRKKPKLRSELHALIILIRTPLEKYMKENKDSKYKSIVELNQYLVNPEEEELYDIISYIENFLYIKDVTKWDKKERVDRTNIFESNRKILG